DLPVCASTPGQSPTRLPPRATASRSMPRRRHSIRTTSRRACDGTPRTRISRCVVARQAMVARDSGARSLERNTGAQHEQQFGERAMSEERVRWGVISTANIGRRAVLPAIQRSRNGELVAVGSREASKAAALARELQIPRAYGSYQ